MLTMQPQGVMAGVTVGHCIQFISPGVSLYHAQEVLVVLSLARLPRLGPDWGWVKLGNISWELRG